MFNVVDTPRCVCVLVSLRVCVVARGLQETVLSRLTVYEEKTRPVLDYYAQMGLLHTIDSPNSDVGYERIKKLMDQLLRQ
jgi:adenylate kinase family enzyme